MYRHARIRGRDSRRVPWRRAAEWIPGKNKHQNVGWGESKIQTRGYRVIESKGNGPL